MDLDKVGTYIAQKRKEKKLTQEKLGELLGDVSGKTISKWERGINAPDISLLKKLSDILEVDIVEILNGQDNDNTNSQDTIVESIEYYTNKTKNTYIKIIVDIIVTILFLLLIIFLVNNYNKVRIYHLTSKNKNYIIEGFIMYNQERNIIVIRNIDLKDSNIGTNLEEKIKEITVSMNCDKKIVFSNYKELDTPKGINSYLLNESYYYDERIKSNEEILSKKVNLGSLFIKIEYVNENNEKGIISIPLITEKVFSNNKLIY